MTFAIFTRSNMVVNPGWLQIADTTAGADQHAAASPSRCSGDATDNPAVDIAAALPAGGASRSWCMFHPDMRVSAAVGVVAGARNRFRHLPAQPGRAAEDAAIARAAGSRCRTGGRSRPRAGRGQARHRIAAAASPGADLGSSLARTRSKQLETWNATERAAHRLDRRRPHGAAHGRAAGQGRPRRHRLEPHRRQGRAAGAAAAPRSSRALADLAGVDVVFSIVSTGKDLEEVYFGPGGVAAGGGKLPAVVRRLLHHRASRSRPRSASGSRALGAQYIAAPVSGNAKVIVARQALGRGVGARGGLPHRSSR